MRFTALSLVFLCVVSSSWCTGFLLDQKSRDDILTTLNELEANSQTLRKTLTESQNSVTKLSDDLQALSLKLGNTEKLLREAKQNLESSEASLAVVKMQLTQASQALTELERSLKDYQRWEVFKIAGAFTLGGLTGLLIGLIL